jgi:hypothetical protein
MSAYGAIVRSPYVSGLLPATFWDSRRAAQDSVPPYVTVHHLTISVTESLPGLIDYLGA